MNESLPNVLGKECDPNPKNGDLMYDVDAKLRLLKFHSYNIYLCKVKAHIGNKWNEEADGLALLASRKVARAPTQKRRKTTANSEDSENSQPSWSLKALLKRKSLGNKQARDIPSSKREARGKVAKLRRKGYFEGRLRELEVIGSPPQKTV